MTWFPRTWSRREQHQHRIATRRGFGIRPRLAAIVLLPTAAAVALVTLRVSDTLTDRHQFSRIESVAKSLPTTYDLATALVTERDAWAVGTDTTAARAATDKATARWRASVKGLGPEFVGYMSYDLQELLAHASVLEGIRGNAGDPTQRTVGYENFTSIADSLVGLVEYISVYSADPGLAKQATSLATLGDAFVALSGQTQTALRALADKSISTDDASLLARDEATWELSLANFQRGAAAAEAARLQEIVSSSEAHQIQYDVDLLRDLQKPSQLRLDGPTWIAYESKVASDLLALAGQEGDKLSADVAALGSSSRWNAILSTLGAILVVALTLLAATAVARSIIRPLRSLSTSALEVARRGLAERVRLIETSDNPDRHTFVEPLGLPASGEIGEVANAFDEVHARALILAAEQAKTRANVQYMFVNLARRSQSLVERQLRLIDQLEEREQDPSQLSALFQLDHLATRMRRNDNSLMVLADVETTRARRGAVPIVDILRAATSEVDQYERVDLHTSEVRAISGSLADDLIHMLAELVENATNFSPPDSKVVIRAEQPGPRADLTIEIEDHGIGMSNDELALANAKVRTLSELDAESARMMGLFVVARLSRRHGLRVELRANRDHGVTAIVSVPADHVTHTSEDGAPTPVVEPREAVPTEPPLSIPPTPIEENTTVDLLVGHVLDDDPARIEPSYEERAAQAKLRIEAAAAAAIAAAQESQEPDARPTNLLGRITPRSASSHAPKHLAMPGVEAEPEAVAEPVAEPYDALASEWFTRRLLPTPEELKARTRAADAGMEPGYEPSYDSSYDSPYESPFASAADETAEPVDWSSPGDDGWRAAAAIAEIEPPTTTLDGLPVRVPGRHLMPGSVEPMSFFTSEENA